METLGGLLSRLACCGPDTPSRAFAWLCVPYVIAHLLWFCYWLHCSESVLCGGRCA